ncbi:hypothetical protein GGS23DRAFT_577771 [Durotheca rogersii]|uniref:uncharacterized protein n=1 Tax=Durotheca rogersii TaxID=419775 RepID=UPI00221FED8E|nr:uncharacterized protein GGS23DRAFT_577771 [Durotheca rogersii]KAI5861254.1 hypothetical protein GGS23DRAFT_577771 [Durotheca rogersii]
MTRPIVYNVALGVFVCTTVITIVSILTPHWVSYSVTADTGSTFRKSLGLHQSCSSVDEPSCRPFPTDDDCRDSDGDFCALWRSSGFLISLATIVELATLVAFFVVRAGGKVKRETGWRIIAGFLLADAVVEFASIGIVAYLFDHDSQFAIPGWHLDWSWVLCTVSATVSVLLAGGLASSAWLLPPEDDYEYLEDPPVDA